MENGTTDNETTTLLASYRQEWVKGGSKDPSKTEAEKLVKAWKAQRAKTEALEAQAEEARKAEQSYVVAMAKAFGCKSLRIDGIQHDFASRGSAVFFRRKNAVDVVDL